ncbi:helicase associated domain-containing protein [Streptomyces pseudovenezuelae]|uniref:helicase associated domain-containing protein n=1 Tax=Streptomyces pseudovenezuelae TaxID=67350 RepID=UPI0036EF0DFF
MGRRPRYPDRDFDHTLDPTAIARALDLMVWPADGAVLSAPRRAGLAAALRYRAEHGHLRVPADYEGAFGYRLGSFITGQRTAYQAGALDAPWVTELEALGMIWDNHEAAWQGHLAAVEAYRTEHGHLAIPAQLPGGQLLVDQRALARKGRLTPDRAAQLAALDPHWLLPHGPDWHRKYHLLRRHLQDGNHPSTLRRDTVIHAVKAGGRLAAPPVHHVGRTRPRPARPARPHRAHPRPHHPGPQEHCKSGHTAATYLRADRRDPPALRPAMGACTRRP